MRRRDLVRISIPGVGMVEMSREEYEASPLFARQRFEALSRDEQLEAIRLVSSWGVRVEDIARQVGWTTAAVRWALTGKARLNG